MIRPTSEASTDACTSYEPVLTRWIEDEPEADPGPPVPGVDPDEDPAPFPAPEVGPAPDAEPDPAPADPDPPTCCPTAYPTEVTVPANGAVIVAPARSAVAELTCPCATVIDAESATSCVLDAPAA